MTMRKAMVAVLACWTMAATGCGATEAELGEEAVPLEQSQDQALGAPAEGTYRLRPDYRKCIYPMCGGFYVRRVNHGLTRCADGRYRAECYVAALDFSALGVSATDARSLRALATQEQLLARGTLGTQPVDPYGDFGALLVSQAWRALTDAPPSGVYLALEDLGIRCITTPCFSMQVALVNWSASRTASDLDLSSLNLGTDDASAAWSALGQGTLLVAGTLRASSPPGATSRGVTVAAAQAYVPVAASASALQCSSDADCGLSVYDRPVKEPADCYCPMCPAPTSKQAASVNAAAWQQHCAQQMTGCPTPMCARPDPWGCVQGVCGTLP